MPSPDSDSAERRIHDILRTLPGRAAPGTLSQRVLAEVQRRESRPRWRRSYLSWPTSLRIAFLVLSAAALVGLAAGPTRVWGALARHIDWLASLEILGRSLIGSAQDVVHAVPAPWLYGTLAAVAAGYAVLAGAGALAYRLFSPVQTAVLASHFRMKLPSLSILRGVGLAAFFVLPLSSFALDPPPPPPAPANASAAPSHDWISGYSRVMADNDIPANERVGGDVVAVMGNNTVDGYVGRDVRTVRGSTTINGTVGRDVIATMGDVVLGPHSVVGRNVVCMGGSLTRAPGSIVRGRIITRSANSYREPRLRLLWRALPAVPDWSDWPPNRSVLRGVLWTIDVVFAGFALLLALVFPQGVRRCGDTLVRRPALTVLMTFLVPLALPLLVVLLCITLIGIPVVIFFLPLAILAATLFGTASIYGLIGRGMSGDHLHPALAVLLGAAFCALFNLIPLLGLVFFIALSTLGLGCAVTALLGCAKPAAAPAGPTPPPAPPSPPPAPAAAAPLPAISADAPPGGTPADPPPLTDAAAIPPISSTLPRAGFWIRMGALFLDALIICIFAHLWFVAIAIYAAVMWKLKGTTVGGIVFGLQVVRIDGRPMEWETAIVRALGCYLSAVVFGLGFLWIALNDENQAWHDKIAGTVVVRTKGKSLL